LDAGDAAQRAHLGGACRLPGLRLPDEAIPTLVGDRFARFMSNIDRLLGAQIPR
jgi:hypothetical protein